MRTHGVPYGGPAPDARGMRRVPTRWIGFLNAGIRRCRPARIARGCKAREVGKGGPLRPHRRRHGTGEGRGGLRVTEPERRASAHPKRGAEPGNLDQGKITEVAAPAGTGASSRGVALGARRLRRHSNR
ncbi:hypothetical protein [Azospirillum endophyticum]